MINRVLLRIKIVQILYAYYKSEGKTLQMVEKELFHSIERTYDLYYHLLNLSIAITDYAYSRIDARRNKLRPTFEDLNPNTKFIDNKFLSQLRSNTMFNEYLLKNKLSWVDHNDIIKTLFEDIAKSDFYQEYMDLKESSYAEDKELWRKIFKRIILNSESLDNSLEDQSIYWSDDVEIVISFIIKTIKRFNEEKLEGQELLPMFKDEEDADFASRLIKATVKNAKEYRELVDKNTKNWELDRIAFMDILIMEVALAELFEFPTIPVNVTLNEYIEIAKNYSTEKSNVFINGVLDNIVNQLKEEKKLTKVVMFSK